MSEIVDKKSEIDQADLVDLQDTRMEISQQQTIDGNLTTLFMINNSGVDSSLENGREARVAIRKGRIEANRLAKSKPSAKINGKFC